MTLPNNVTPHSLIFLYNKMCTDKTRLCASNATGIVCAHLNFKLANQNQYTNFKSNNKSSQDTFFYKTSNLSEIPNINYIYN